MSYIDPTTGRMVDDSGTTPVNTSGASANQPSFLNNILNLGDPSGWANNASNLGFLTTAANQYNQAGRYTQLGKDAASMASPVTTADRQYYIDQLNKSYTDPAAFLSDPGHQATQKFGLDSLSRQDAMKGYLGSGNMATDLGKYINQSDNTFLDSERARLSNLGGFQFDPSSAASMMMKGGELGMQSENAALGALMAPFLAQQAANRQANPTNGGNPTVDPSKLDFSKIAGDPKAIADQLSKYASLSGSTVKQLWDYMMSNPNVSDSTKEILKSVSPDQLDQMNTVTRPDGGGVFDRGDQFGNTPPPNYDPNAPAVNPDGSTNTGSWRFPEVGGSTPVDNWDLQPDPGSNWDTGGGGIDWGDW